MRKTRFTIITGVNTLYNALAEAPDISKVDFSHLMTSNAGGMAVQEAVAGKWKALTGSVISEGYGLSETSPVVTANRGKPEAFSGTIGVPVPSTEVSLRAPEDGAEVPVGSPGELCVRGPQVMQGYWQAPHATAAVFYPDGFFRTGDVATMSPDGQFRIVDRIKDMISVSGLKVTPNEIEAVIASHPEVIETAVDRPARPPFRRGGDGLCRQPVTEPHGGRGARLVPRAARRLQGAAACGFPGKLAEEQRRQGPAACLAR